MARQNFRSSKTVSGKMLVLTSLLGLIVLNMNIVEGGTGLYMGPYFASPGPKNITVHENSVAYLPCTVKQLGDKMVSWVRQTNSDILTIGTFIFVQDRRFSVHFSKETSTWTLVIKGVENKDAGAYECQISTEPKMFTTLNLKVIVPQIDIIGEKEKFIKIGSTTNLECRVLSGVQLPDYIFWYHKERRILENGSPRVTISSSRQGGANDTMSLTSILTIHKTKLSDKGNYSCLPSNLDGAMAFLHVLSGEHPAAMQSGSMMNSLTLPIMSLVFLCCTVAITLTTMSSLSIDNKR